MTLRQEIIDLTSIASRKLIEGFLKREHADLDPQARAAICRGTLLHEPASDASVAQSEARLGVTLPSDYRTFLTISDGMAMPLASGHIGRLLSASELTFLCDASCEFLNLWTEGSNGEPFAPLQAMPEVAAVFTDNLPDASILRSAIAISDVSIGSAILICQFEAFGPNIHETWEVDAWGGLSRYRSFKVFLERSLGRACAEWSESP